MQPSLLRSFVLVLPVMVIAAAAVFLPARTLVIIDPGVQDADFFRQHAAFGAKVVMLVHLVTVCLK